MLTEEDKAKLKIAKEWCDEEVKSIDFMLEYMCDVANCGIDDVLDFLEEQEETHE